MRFEEMDIWKDSRSLCKDINKITKYEEFKKDFKLCNQIRASAGSIMDNIAEGYERGGNKELIQFLYIAKGSCGETRSQIYRAYDFNYISQEEQQELCNKCIKISKKISGFINYLRKSTITGEKYIKQPQI